MTSKDVILQVADETAEIMEEISEQLFDETDARFDEIAEAIAKSVTKIEKLYVDFTGYTEAYDKKAKDNQAEIISKFKGLQDGLVGLKDESKEDYNRVEEKVTRLITITSELPALIKTISKEVGAAFESSREADEVVIDAVRDLSESLLKVQEMQTAITQHINTDDTCKKLGILSEKLSETEKRIQTEKATVDRMSETLDRFGLVLDRLEADVKYLKLPFYKRWFTKG